MERHVNLRTISLFAVEVYSKVVEALSSTFSRDGHSDSFFNPYAVYRVVLSLNHQFNFFGQYLVDLLALALKERSSPVIQLAPVTDVPSDRIYFMALDELSIFSFGALKNYEKALEINNQACNIYPSNPSLYL